MSDLGIKPLEVKDLSGGITDYYLQGDPKRSQRLDNFLINVDKQAEMRYGSTAFDSFGNHKLPAPIRRIDKFLLFKAEEELLVNQARDIYYLNNTPAWTRMTGPSGNEAVGAGESHHALSYSEWNGHVYFTSDAGPIPGKFYKGEDGSYVVKTAGLPLPVSTPRYTDTTLFAACVNLANELKAKMISHMQDTSLHTLADTVSQGYLSIANATTEATLYALIEQLVNAYNYHGNDVDTLDYHKVINYTLSGSSTAVPPKGPFERIKSDPTPEDLETAAITLDELRKKWIWHILGIFSHDATNTYATINQYMITAPEIGSTDTVGIPYITPNYSDFIRYVNYLKNAFNNHVSNEVYGADWSPQTPSLLGMAHFQNLVTEQYTLLTLPDAYDLNSAFLLTYWTWVNYYIHFRDAEVATGSGITMDVVAGSANVTDVKNPSGAVTLTVGSYVYGEIDYFSDGPAAKVLASGSGTATLSKVSLFTTGDAAFTNTTTSVYHGASNIPTGTSVSYAQYITLDETLEPPPGLKLANNTSLPATTEAWIALAEQVFFALDTHMQNVSIHYDSGVGFTGVLNYVVGNGSFFLPEVEDVAYAFVYNDTYTLESGIEFTTRSAPLVAGAYETGKIYPVGTLLTTGFDRVDLNEEDPPEGFSRTVEVQASVAISNLPVLTNDSITNYDTTNIVVEVYRTTDSGNTYYLAGEVDNGTTTFTDSISDSLNSPGIDALDTRQLLYTTGGVVPNDQPLPSKYLHILDGTTYFGGIVDAGQTFNNRYIQSVPGIPDGGPANFSDDLDDEIIGISSARNTVIVFCKNSVFRVQNAFNNKGQGFLSHEKISDELGCVSTNSIVKTEIGVFFAGTDGFYYTDGFQVVKISIDLDLSYAARIQSDAQKRVISGTYDRLTRRIWWTMMENPSDVDADHCYIYHLNYGVKPSGCFTTASNDSYFRPSALVFYQSKLIRGDMRGLVFKHDYMYKSDPKIPTDVTTSFSTWGEVYIPWDYTSTAIDFGSTFKGQWVTKIHFLGENQGNVNIQINSIAENRNNTLGKKPLAPISYRENLMWGDPTVSWGDPTCIWEYDGKLDFWRRFSVGTLRSQLKQVQFTPAYVGIYRYDDYPEFSYVAVNSTSKTATLSTPTGYTDIIWPLDVVDMYIAFSVDNFENEFLITAVADEVITFSDADDLISANLTSQTWVVRGYQKEARISMLSYVIHFAELGFRGKQYAGSTDRGENA